MLRTHTEAANPGDNKVIFFGTTSPANKVLLNIFSIKYNYSITGVSPEKHPFYPFFQEWSESETKIKEANFFVISLNSHLEAFLNTADRTKESPQYLYNIKLKFNTMVTQLREGLLKTLADVQALNPNAKIIVATHYYLPAWKNPGLIAKIGEAMGFHYESDTAMVMQYIMRAFHTGIIKPADPVIVADLTSSTNPFDPRNYIYGWEPTPKVGTTLAELLNYIITPHDINVETGKAYRLYSKVVHPVALDQWKIASPYDLQMGYTYEEETLYTVEGLEQIRVSDLCNKLEQQISNSFDRVDPDFKDPIHQAAQQVLVQAKLLIPELNTDAERKRFKISLAIAMEVLNDPTEANLRMLHENAQHRSFGKAEGWKQFAAALLGFVAGALIITAAVTWAPVASAAGICLFAAAGMSVITGAAFFVRYNQREMAKSLDTLHFATPRNG